jgi:4'-phosphopantetheinyl transferase
VTNFPQIDYSLTEGRIDLWLVQLSFDAFLMRGFRDLLGPEEAARARAFRFERSRENYTIAHGILRVLIGRYLGEEPATLRFSVGPTGKPHMVHPDRIQFNLSHSDDIVLFGFTRACELGVDVEKIRPMDDSLDIARRFFCPEEIRDLMSCPPNERQHAFFRCWTRKEAFLKAVGTGFQMPLDSFRVSLCPSPARLLHIDRSQEAAEKWTLHSLDFSPLWCAALAYPAPLRQVRLISWGPEVARAAMVLD